jgi:hypothetical protein
VSPSDHHSEYLARPVAALTPDGRGRVDELLEQLAAAARGDERVVRFALDRRAEVDAGGADTLAGAELSHVLTEQERDGLLAGFMRIRDQEPHDDVADWANAVVALLEDEAGRDHRA